MQSEMDAAAEEQLGSPPGSPPVAEAAQQQAAGSQAQPARLSAYERVRMRMLPEMVTVVQMFASSICEAFGRSVQSEEDVRLVRGGVTRI